MCVCIMTPFLNHPAKGFPQREQSVSQRLALSCVFFPPCFQPIGEMLSSSEPWPAHMSLPLQAYFP